MDLHSHLSRHLFSLVKASGGNGQESSMKALLADSHSLAQVSLCCPQSSMMEMGVYMFQTLEHKESQHQGRLEYLTCITFVQPTAQAFSALQAELRKPQFGRYYIYITGHVSRAQIKALAEADVHEVVVDIGESPIGFLPLEPHLFILQSKATMGDIQPSLAVEGVESLLKSIGMRPHIAYSKNSESCQSIAEQLGQLCASRERNESIRDDATVLLVDRSKDPITPLLMQWTYQAMIQEIFGIVNGVVDLSQFNVPADLAKVVLSSKTDTFYQANMYKNFGEIGEIVRQLVQDYQHTVAGHQNIESIGDIRDFVSSYPEFKKITGTVTKHVSLISELSRVVADHNLLPLSEFEQNLVSGQETASPLAALLELLGHPNIRAVDAKRLICLLTLVETPLTTKELATLCEKANLDRMEMSELIHALSKYSRGIGGRVSGEGFSSQGSSGFTNASNKLEKKTKRLLRGLRGIENVYTQHEPLVKKYIVETVGQRFLPDLEYTDSFAFTDNLVVFIVGGVTYEESRWAQELNKQLRSKVIVGGDCIWSAHSFLQYLESKKKISSQ